MESSSANASPAAALISPKPTSVPLRSVCRSVPAIRATTCRLICRAKDSTSFDISARWLSSTLSRNRS